MRELLKQFLGCFNLNLIQLTKFDPITDLSEEIKAVRVVFERSGMLAPVDTLKHGAGIMFSSEIILFHTLLPSQSLNVADRLPPVQSKRSP